MREFEVFVLLAQNPDDGRYTPVGCDERHDSLMRLKEVSAENMRLANFAASSAQKATTEAIISSMMILPAKLSFDV